MTLENRLRTRDKRTTYAVTKMTVQKWPIQPVPKTGDRLQRLQAQAKLGVQCQQSKIHKEGETSRSLNHVHQQLKL